MIDSLLPCLKKEVKHNPHTDQECDIINAFNEGLFVASQKVREEVRTRLGDIGQDASHNCRCCESEEEFLRVLLGEEKK